MSCLAQSGDGDLLLTSAGGSKRMTLITDVSACAAQKLTNRFLLFLGEWFLDTRLGLAYFSFIAVKNPNIGALTSYFRKVILSVPAVAAINTLTVNLMPNRQAVVNFNGTTNEGVTIIGGQGPLFIVQP